MLIAEIHLGNVRRIPDGGVLELQHLRNRLLRSTDDHDQPDEAVRYRTSVGQGPVPLITIEEALNRAPVWMRVAGRTVRRWCRAGGIPGATRVGKTWMLPPDEFDRWIAERDRTR